MAEFCGRENRHFFRYFSYMVFISSYQNEYLKEDFMRNIAGVIAVLFLAGCTGSPPKPPTVKGEYRPVNSSNETSNRHQIIPAVFDFDYEGDIVKSLEALRAIQPQLKIAPPTGNVTALTVRVHLQDITLEDALRAIGEQGRGVAEVAWNKPDAQFAGQVFIRFYTTYHPLGNTAAIPYE
jgi:hypothetical protein